MKTFSKGGWAKPRLNMRKKQIKGTILAGAIMMAAMSMTTNAMAADITPAVQSETPATPTPAAEPPTEPATEPATEPETPAPPETEAPQPETPAETNPPQTEAPETEAPETEAPQPETPAETDPPETEAPETEATPESDFTSTPDTEKKPVTKPQKDTADNKTNNSVSKNTKEPAKYVTENATNSNVKISGFSIDPSQYLPVDINENTRLIYQYLTKEMGLNHAAACGVLANIQHESNFNTFAVGDGGTSYGICQWHNSRFSALMAHCQSKGLDYNTLEGQLSYLEHELSTGYKSVLNVLKNVPNSEQGAYDAAYAWCMHFEVPADTVNRSIQRGNLAREYFHREFSLLEDEAERIERLLEIVEG